MSAVLSPWLPLIPLLLVGVGAFALMLVDAFSDEDAQLATLSSVVLFAAALIAASLALRQQPLAASPAGFAAYLSFDRFTQFLNVTLCAGAGMSALLAGGYLHEHALERGEFYALLLLATFGAQVLVAANDLLTVFIGLETKIGRASCRERV